MNNQNRLSLWPSLANTHRHEPNGPLRFPPELRCPRLSLVPILRSYQDPRRTFRLNSRPRRCPARLSGLSSRLVQPSARYRHLPGGWSQNLGGSLASAPFSVPKPRARRGYFPSREVLPSAPSLCPWTAAASPRGCLSHLPTASPPHGSQSGRSTNRPDRVASLLKAWRCLPVVHRVKSKLFTPVSGAPGGPACPALIHGRGTVSLSGQMSVPLAFAFLEHTKLVLSPVS